MNKKNLSVVMAGAMLATSVAPVLADTTSTGLPSSISSSHAALLKSGITKLMESETVTDATDNRLSGIVPGSNGNGESIYGLEVIAADGTVKNAISYATNAADTAISNLEEGDKVRIYTREYNKFLGLNVLSTVPTVNPGSGTMYQNTDIENIAKIINKDTSITQTVANNYPGLITVASTNLAASDDLNDYIKEDSAVITTSEDGTKKTVTFKLKAKDNLTSNVYRTVSITAGETALDFNMPLGKTEDGSDLLLEAPKNDGSTYAADLQECYGFAKDVDYTEGTALTGDKKTLTQEITITAATSTGDTSDAYLASDLYDGFALTAKGTEIAELINNDKYTVKYAINGGSENTSISNVTSDIVVSPSTGICNLTIKIQSAKNNTLRTIEVYSTNATEMQSLYKILNGDYNVGIIGGANRYETAVNVAKAQGVKKIGTAASTPAAGTGITQNIVLVNGTSLVDGLAAAPLAASINGTGKIAAPVLLSETDKLPTATKEYLEELIKEGDLSPSDMKSIKINLVGGTGVLSASLEKDLKDMGFTVVRYGGDDREETSIKVAKGILSITGNTTIDDVFVVGGNGEADAMSIAPVASSTKALAVKTETTVRPIIVSSVHGVSDSAASYISEVVGNDGSVTIVGGTGVVSTDDEVKIDEMLDDAITNGSTRIEGANRFETNAKIISTYYNSVASDAAVMVKDGMSNKNELVDALSAANYAADKKAPIVLASKEVKDTQKTALLGITSGSVKKVVQIGQGAERTVLETIADLFGVSNL